MYIEDLYLQGLLSVNPTYQYVFGFHFCFGTQEISFWYFHIYMT